METSDYGDTDLRHVIEGDSRGRRDEESFGKHGYTKQEFSGEELVNVEEDEDMEDEDDMIEFEEPLMMRNKKGERIHGRNNQRQ